MTKGPTSTVNYMVAISQPVPIKVAKEREARPDSMRMRTTISCLRDKDAVDKFHERAVSLTEGPQMTVRVGLRTAPSECETKTAENNGRWGDGWSNR